MSNEKSGSKPPASKSSGDVSGDASNALWRMNDWYSGLDPKLLESLKTYHGELLKFNLRLNLISRATERDADETHFADSLLAAQLLVKAGLGKKVYDIGSGNGLPGLVLAMMVPDSEFCLVEADGRKAEFLKHVQHVLGIKNCQVLNVRLETLKGANMECAVSRGFASISKTVLAVNRSMAKGGKFFHLKGNSWSSEVAEIPSQLISHWKPALLGEYSLPVSQVRRAIVCTTKLTA